MITPDEIGGILVFSGILLAAGMTACSAIDRPSLTMIWLSGYAMALAGIITWIWHGVSAR